MLIFKGTQRGAPSLYCTVEEFEKTGGDWDQLAAIWEGKQELEQAALTARQPTAEFTINDSSQIVMIDSFTNLQGEIVNELIETAEATKRKSGYIKKGVRTCEHCRRTSSSGFVLIPGAEAEQLWACSNESACLKRRDKLTL